jgi:hypothetical protein
MECLFPFTEDSIAQRGYHMPKVSREETALAFLINKRGKDFSPVACASHPVSLATFELHLCSIKAAIANTQANANVPVFQ